MLLGTVLHSVLKKTTRIGIRSNGVKFDWEKVSSANAPHICCVFVRLSTQPQDEVHDPRQVLARPTWVADRGVRCDRSQWSGKNLGRAFRLANGNFGLFGLANTHISVFGLANTQISVCSVWPMAILVRSVWPIPRSVLSVQCGQWSGKRSGLRSGQGSGLGSTRSGHWSGQRSGRRSGLRSGKWSGLGSVRSGHWSGKRSGG